MGILVTGGAGFIGSHLSEKLIAEGNEVAVLDSFVSSKPENAQKGAEIIKHDITKPLEPRLLQGYETVFHLAADPSVRASAENARGNFQANVLGTFNVLEAARAAGVKKFVFTSTSTVYGNAEMRPTPETHPTAPISNYGASKLAGEAYCASFAHTYGMKSTVLRLANIFGERGTHGVMFDFYSKLRKNPGRMEILGNGKQSKSYLYVSDCISAILLAPEKQGKIFDIFNVGTWEQHTVGEIAKLVSGEMGLSPSFYYTGGEAGWVGDVSGMLLDVKKLKSLGWKPNVSFEQGVSRYIKWLKAHF